MFAVDVKMDEIFVDFFKEIDCKKIAHRLALNQKLLISWFVSEISEVPSGCIIGDLKLIVHFWCLLNHYFKD